MISASVRCPNCRNKILGSDPFSYDFWPDNHLWYCECKKIYDEELTEISSVSVDLSPKYGLHGAEYEKQVLSKRNVFISKKRLLPFQKIYLLEMI